MRRKPGISWSRAVLVLASVFLAAGYAQAQLGATVTNWPPASFTPASAVQGGMHLMNDVTNPIAFVGITPCRVVDTRQPSGPFGGPKISPGSPRSFAIPSGPCPGIPSEFLSEAYSLNITAVNPSATGFIKVFPEGGSSPVVSTVNFVAGQTIANAAVVAAQSSTGGITVAASATTDVLIDINGYYTDTPNNGNNSFVLTNNSVNYTMSLFNASMTCVGICGLNVAAAHGSAIEGDAEGNDVNYGVYGQTDSTMGDSSGIFGTDLSGAESLAATGFVQAGVRGNSGDNIGVLGASRGAGVEGAQFDTSGSMVADGKLGSGGYGVYADGNFGGTGAKYFVEPHPTDASRVIRYVSLEGPESGTYFRGSGQIVGGQAVIEVPESFRMVTDTEGLTVQLTPVGAWAGMYVMSENLDQIVIHSDRDVQFHYLVNGVRRAFKDHQAISDGQEFMPRSASERMPGYLTEEARSRLITNGTYNADGTVNMGTAERLGWTKMWANRQAEAQAAAAQAAAARARAALQTPGP